MKNPPPDALKSFEAMNAKAPVNHEQNQALTDPVESCPLKKKWHLRIVVRDQYFQLWRNKKYKLTVGGDVYTGSTGDTAAIDHPVAPLSTSGELSVWIDEDPEAAPLKWNLTIDDVDPLALDTGAETRLRNLGIDWQAEASGAMAARAELETFQGAFKVKAQQDGGLDGQTRGKLGEVYSEKQIKEVREQYYVWEGLNL